MRPEIYDRITNTCLILAVASALLFEKLPYGRWIAGVVAMLAGLVAAATYFYNQWRSEDTANSKTGQSPERAHSFIMSTKVPDSHEDFEATLASEAWAGLTGSVFHFRREGYKRHLFHRSFWEGGARNCSVHYFGAAQFYSEPETKEPDTFVEKVVHIVQRLSPPEENAAYEFVLSRDGNFTIRPIARSKVHRIVESSSLEERLASSLIPDKVPN